MLAEEHFNSDRFHLAYLFALRAAQIKAPENLDSVSACLCRIPIANIPY